MKRGEECEVERKFLLANVLERASGDSEKDKSCLLTDALCRGSILLMVRSKTKDPNDTLPQY